MCSTSSQRNIEFVVLSWTPNILYVTKYNHIKEVYISKVGVTSLLAYPDVVGDVLVST